MHPGVSSFGGIAHLAAGVDWLGIPVPRPVPICIIENERPADLFQRKLEAKIASWGGPAFTDNVSAFAGPWGEFSFADAEAREALVAFCEEHAIDVVMANPTLGLGVAASGRPDETQAFVDWLVECGLKSERAFWLLHHENKAGQISGDWGRHPDTKVQLQQDGNQQRTKTRLGEDTVGDPAERDDREDLSARVGRRDPGLHRYRARHRWRVRFGARAADRRLRGKEPALPYPGRLERERDE